MSINGNATEKNVVRGAIGTPKYVRGASAYEIAVINGFNGTEEEWLESLKGEKGEPGYTPQKDIDYSDGKDGADGKSIFCSTEQKKATESADFHMQFIQNGDREVTVGDLILSSSGWLYRVTKISGTIATASFMSILKGEKGDSASVDDVLAAIPTVTNITVTEHGDGRFTQVKEFSDGSEEVTEVTVDENGIPIKLTVNGVEIPCFFRYGGDDPVIPEEPEIPEDPVIPDESGNYLYGHVASADETPDVYIGDVGYVGAVLPNINTLYTHELQKSHPYAYIVARPTSTYTILISPVPAEYVSGKGWIIRGTSLYADVLADSSWSDWKIDEGDAYIHLEQYSDVYRVIWCNTDLVSLTGSVFMEASEPIPIYE